MSRDRLAQFAAELRHHVVPTDEKDLPAPADPILTPELADYVAASIEQYVMQAKAFECGELKDRPTLDAAFDVAVTRGRPPEDIETQPAKRKYFTTALHRHGRGETWEDIAADIDPTDVKDASTVRKFVARYADRMVHYMARKLKQRRGH